MGKIYLEKMREEKMEMPPKLKRGLPIKLQKEKLEKPIWKQLFKLSKLQTKVL